MWHGISPLKSALGLEVPGNWDSHYRFLKMQLVWPFDSLFSEEFHFLLDQYFEVMMNLYEARTIARARESFKNFNSQYGIGFGVAVIVAMLIAVALFSMLKKWPLMLPLRDGLHPPPGTMGWPFFGETAQLKAKRLTFYLEKRKKWVLCLRFNFCGAHTSIQKSAYCTGIFKVL